MTKTSGTRRGIGSRARGALVAAAIALGAAAAGACQSQVCGCPRDAGAAGDDDEVSARFTLVSESVCTEAQLDAGCENLARPRR